MPSGGESPRSLASWGLCNLLLAMLLLGISATSRPHRCPRESIGLLKTIMHRLGNSSSDGTLYTPQDITVCYAENLDCFTVELQVIQDEQEEHTEILSRLMLRLNQTREKWQRENWSEPSTNCLPCHSHPEKPVKVFLQRLQQMFQWKCRTLSRPRKVYYPSPAP